MGVPTYHPEHARALLQNIRDQFGLDEDNPQKAYLRVLGERLLRFVFALLRLIDVRLSMDFIPIRRISF